MTKPLKKCPTCDGKGMDSWSEPFDQSTAAVCPDCLGDGEDTSYENRFRDPEFLAVWERWQKARHAWDKCWKNLPFKCFTEDNDVYTPDPARIPEGTQRTTAQEYLDARAAYKAKIAAYPTDPV
jgi:hypothetical protein